MTTPPQKLRSILRPGVCFQLRAPDGATLGTIEYTEAMGRAIRGEIEGVCTSHGKVRYVRVLPVALRCVPEPDEAIPASMRMRSGNLNAATNLGAYKQELSSGWTWALKLCKGIDGAHRGAAA